MMDTDSRVKYILKYLNRDWQTPRGLTTRFINTPDQSDIITTGHICNILKSAGLIEKERRLRENCKNSYITVFRSKR